MKEYTVLKLCLFLVGINHVKGSDYELYEYLNRTEPSRRQPYEFKLEHPRPIGITTTSSGQLVELRDTITLNSDTFSNHYFIDHLSHSNVERIPERVVHARGNGAFGYFEVTHDVSKYIKSDVFNGIGKKTHVLARFSGSSQNLGGSELVREQKGFAIKFYTKEGNLDMICFNIQVFFYRNPIDFGNFIRSQKQNLKNNLFDLTTRWDFATKKADNLHAFLWALSDFGIPNGYRKMDAFPIHTYEIYNKHGDKYFVRFNYRTNQGLEFLSSQTAAQLMSQNPEYFPRDLYNAIENKNYPSWNLEMDVMTLDDIKKLDYNPFDITRFWKEGTYKTVQIGRVVLDRNPDNHFKDVELSGFNPGNLVPGISGAPDGVFRARRSAYRNTQIYRLGVNHNRIDVNKPLYWKVYNRDGVPPVEENMKDAPNYYPNSFNGPVPYVDPSRPKERYEVYESNAVDLQPAADFYNNFLQCEDQRERLVNNTIRSILTISPKLQRRVIRLFTLTDLSLGAKVAEGLEKALKRPPPPPPPALTFPDKNQCNEAANLLIYQ